MTDGDRVRPEPPPEKAPGPGAGGGRIQRFKTAHERSLAEMMSISNWRSFVPESIVLIVAISLLRDVVLDGPAAPGSMPHPFWIPVLLMSSQYGIMGGLFATLAATAAFFIGGLPPQSASQDFYAYASVVAGQPCAWFGSALILGGLRTLHIHHQTELQAQLEQTRLAAEDLADGLERSVGEIARLERRIAVDSSTLTSFTHSLARLDLSDRSSLIAGFADLIRHSVGATSFTIHLKGERGLEPVLGIENGSSLTPAAIAPLAPALLDEIRQGPAARDLAPAGGGGRLARTPLCMPLWAPIRLAGAANSVGVVVCSRLQPAQDPAIAARRLDDVCHVLAIVLSTCPEGVCGDP